MKLVKQTKLFFQEGTSDKVYEIDLCESGDGFLVNFRYGRRGAALKEGTKTIFPVPLKEAENVFAALEIEKRKKGYVAAGEAPIVVADKAVSRGGSDKRRKTIVKLLKASAAGEAPEHWQLSRIIWRAGDLKIKEAVPYIIQVADPSDPDNIYSVVWAIARCGTSSTLGYLHSLRENKNLNEHTRHLISEAVLKLSDPKDQQTLRAAILESLPRHFKNSIATKDPKQFKKDLHEFLFELKTASNEYLVGVYQLTRNEPALHAVFLVALSKIKLEHNYFKYIRTIFKTAEMLEDYSVYGVLAKQFEKQPSAYQLGNSSHLGNNEVLGFSQKTKKYLCKRIVRQLRKYGEAGEDSYPELATEILLAFRDDEDLKPPYHTSTYKYTFNQQTRTNNYVNTRTDFDSYAKYGAFNYILFKNSGRYTLNKDTWACVPPFVPGNAAPIEREEAFPHLWNNAPEEVIILLSHSNVNWVQDFATKIWNANPVFETHIETRHIIAFLKSYGVRTQQLGLSLAKKKYDAVKPDTILLAAMLESQLEEARKQAEMWISSTRTTLLGDTSFVSSLMRMRTVEAHAWLRGFLSTHTFTQQQAEVVIASTISHLISADTDSEEDLRYINQVGDSLIMIFGDFLKNINLDVVRDLFSKPAAVLQGLGGKILTKHSVRPEELPEDFLSILLSSDNAQSRAIGISLLSRFPDDFLLKKKEILVSFCLSALPDVRDAVKPIIMRLVTTHPEFGDELVNLFVPAFLMKESYEGLHEDLLGLLSHELANNLRVIPKEKTMILLNSRYRTSQRIGNILLKKTVDDSDLTVGELVKMGNNPIEEVRKYTWDTFKKYSDKIRAYKEEAIKITDTDWDDTRIFALDFFRTAFQAADWNTDLLVMLCDSTREDVQDFAREMITRFFDDSQGYDYLLKLSQHPSTKVQLFTTTYLQQYATGKIELMKTLKPYFVTLLSQVNRGRVAKTRIMDFLRKESARDEASAQLTAEILARVSASVAIQEKAEYILALRDIRKQYPSVDMPIVTKDHIDYVRH